ncbi:hypothetical protein ACLM5H_24490 [Fredinandcohnia humi]
MFIAQIKRTLMIFSIVLVSACTKPIITESVSLLQVTCKDGNNTVIKDQDIILEIIDEINTSTRENAQEMEFLSEGYNVRLETNTGKRYDVTLFESGKVVIDGYYVSSNIDNFCIK